MQEFEARPKKWGSSLGIIIPKEITKKQHIHENEKIIVEIKKGKTAGDFFGLFAGWSKSTEELKKEMKKGWK